MSLTLLACLATFALLCLVVWLDYRRVCRREAERWSSQLPENHLGKERL